MIQVQVRQTGLVDILGSVSNVNVQDEVQQKLNVYVNETLINCLRFRESIGIIASKEYEYPIEVHNNSQNTCYAIVINPLDGSSDINVAVTIGTSNLIFGRPVDSRCE